MSKKSRQKRKQKRAQDKRAQKQSRKAQYSAWAAAGVTKSSKRARTNKAKARKVRTRRQGVGSIPFPYHLWLKSDGTLHVGAPHKAFLAMKRDQEV